MADVNLTSGAVTFVGGHFLVIVDDILGRSGDLVHTQQTKDSYHLVDALQTFEVDYYPYHVFELETQFIASGVTFTTPYAEISSEHTAISAGHVAPTYMQDFYFRIHFEENPIPLGNIFADLTKNTSMWSAFLTTNNISAILKSGLESLTLVSPTAPYLAQPLEIVPLVIDVPLSGEPTIVGDYTFTLDSGTEILTITGSRVILWPFMPDLSFSEERQWLTDVFEGYGAETRNSIRETPRISLPYKYILRTRREFIYAKNIAEILAGFKIALPLATDYLQVGVITAADTSITIDTTNLEVVEGGNIILWESYLLTEVLEVQSIVGNLVTFTSPVINTYANAWIMPAYFGYSESGVNFRLTAGQPAKADITVLSEYAYNNPVLLGNTYESLPVIEKSHVNSGGLSSRVFKSAATFDSVTGMISKVDKENYVRKQEVLSLTLTSQQDIYAYRRFFDFLQGRLNPFFVPSFIEDIVPVTDFILDTVDNIVVKSELLLRNSPEYIRVIGDPTTIFKVLSIDSSGLPADETRITFTVPASGDILNIKYIEVMKKFRLDSDKITFKHRKNVATVRVPIKEVKA